MLWRDFDDFNGFWDPWREFEWMKSRLSRLVSEPVYDLPPVNIWVSGDEAVVTTELPGIDPGDVDISVTGKTLTIRGSRRAEELKDEEYYHRRERWSGQLSKAIELPFNIEADKVDARFTKGVLYITLPKAEAERPRKIEIKAE
jgi:HSP20 family protein